MAIYYYGWCRYSAAWRYKIRTPGSGTRERILAGRPNAGNLCSDEIPPLSFIAWSPVNFLRGVSYMERFAPRFMCDECSLRMEVRRRLSVSDRYMGAIVFETLKLRNSRILSNFLIERVRFRRSAGARVPKPCSAISASGSVHTHLELGVVNGNARLKWSLSCVSVLPLYQQKQ